MAMVLVVFAFNIGNFPQQAIVQYPSNIIFYLSIAIIVACMRLDLQQQNAPAATGNNTGTTALTELN
jgi:hypothetical protein